MNHSKDNKRPFSVTILCIFIIVGIISSLPNLINNIAEFGITDTITIYQLIVTIMSGIFLYGFFNMKKWSVIFFLIVSTIAQVMMINRGVWHISYLVFPSVIMMIGLINFKSMK
jgi:hypothetical protein